MEYMSRWRQHIKDMFARPAQHKAAVPAAAPEAPSPPPIPPQSMDDMYGAFRRDILPVLQALKSLPRDETGLEFFMRADVLTPDMVQNAEDARIDVWLFYTRETGPSPKLHQAPQSHLISLESKKSTPERPDFSQLLAIGDTPVLRLCIRPQESGDMRITSHTYIESYEKPQAGKKYSIYSGDYGMVITESVKTSHARAEALRGAIDGWMATYAPSQIRALHDVLNPKTEIDLLPPLNIRKRTP